MKKFLLILVILFVSGVIAADICISGLQEENIWINMSDFQTYAYSKVTFKDVIWNMLYARGKIMLCLIVLGLTPWREKMPGIFLGIFLFCLGFFSMSCILELGFVGIVIAIASIFPHGIFYVTIFLILYKRQSHYGYQAGKNIGQMMATYLFILLLFVTGCVMECVMGVHFIPWIIRLSLV